MDENGARDDAQNSLHHPLGSSDPVMICAVVGEQPPLGGIPTAICLAAPDHPYQPVAKMAFQLNGSDLMVMASATA